MEIDIDNGLPATIKDSRTQLLQARNTPKLLGLILANVAALFSAAKYPTVVSHVGMTRPADTTAYASGDLVANSVTAGSVTAIPLELARANGGTGQIRRVRLKKTGTNVTNAAFRVHLFTSDPTVTNGDNGVFAPTHSGYLGAFDVASMIAFSAAAQGQGVPLVGSEITFKAQADRTTIYALIEARGAYTPSSAEIFTLSAELLQA